MSTRSEYGLTVAAHDAPLSDRNVARTVMSWSRAGAKSEAIGIGTDASGRSWWVSDDGSTTLFVRQVPEASRSANLVAEAKTLLKAKGLVWYSVVVQCRAGTRPAMLAFIESVAILRATKEMPAGIEISSRTEAEKELRDQGAAKLTVSLLQPLDRHLQALASVATEAGELVVAAGTGAATAMKQAGGAIKLAGALTGVALFGLAAYWLRKAWR